MRLEGLHFAAFAHYDAYINNAGGFAQAVNDAGATVDFLTLNARNMNLSEAQIAAACDHWPVLKGRTPARLNIDSLRDPAFVSRYDGIFLGAGGGELLAGFKNLAEAFAHLGPRRPVVVTGFPGIVDAGRTAGMLFRCPSDIVLLPAFAQVGIYRLEMLLLGKKTSNSLLYGMPSLPRSVAPARRSSTVRRILFIDQSAIPQSVEERRELVGQLATLLEKLPHAEMWIRERVREGETSIHEGNADIKLSALISAMLPHVPSLSRVRFKQQPLPILFQEVDAALSVSSTGLIEALAAGLPVASLKEFSRIPRYGNSFFKNSGIQVSIENLVEAGWPMPNLRWVQRNVLSPLQRTSRDDHTGQERLVRRLHTLLDSPRGGLLNPADHGRFARKIARLMPHILLQKTLMLFR